MDDDDFTPAELIAIRGAALHAANYFTAHSPAYTEHHTVKIAAKYEQYLREGYKPPTPSV